MAVQSFENDQVSPAWDRLEDQLGWYGRKSVIAQQDYKRVKLSQLIVGADPYRTGGRCRVLAERLEGAISPERVEWAHAWQKDISATEPKRS
jgi:hypothetical protein